MQVSCSLFFFFKQKTAYEMRISDWSSDVCSSDLHAALVIPAEIGAGRSLASQQLVRPQRNGLAGFRDVIGNICRADMIRHAVRIFVVEGIKAALGPQLRDKTRLSPQHRLCELTPPDQGFGEQIRSEENKSKNH